MPRDLTTDPSADGAPRALAGHLILDLRGAPARALARRLLAPKGLDEAWAGIDALLGAATRVAHDWDPATGRLTVAAPA